MSSPCDQRSGRTVTWRRTRGSSFAAKRGVALVGLVGVGVWSVLRRWEEVGRLRDIGEALENTEGAGLDIWRARIEPGERKTSGFR